MELLILIVFIFLLFSHFGLRSRVSKLEEILAQSSVPVAPLYSPEMAVPAAPPPAPPYLMQENDGNDLGSRFAAWAKEDWLLKLGALLLLIGFGWLVSYAFLNNWIGPMGRITLGLLLGVGILALGFWRLQQFTHQGSIFLVLGATVVLLTIFAARVTYDFFTPLSALIMMFLTAAFVAFASVQRSVHSLALAGLLLAALAPLLVRSPAPDYIGLFSYLFMVMLGILCIVVLRGWRDLLVAALSVMTLYSLPMWSSFARLPVGEIKTLTYMSFGLALVFFVFNLFAFLKGENIEKEGGHSADLVSAVWIGAFLIPWIFVGIDREFQSLILSTWAALFALGAFFCFVQTGNRKPLYAYVAVGILLLGTATARELDGAALTIAFTLEASAITFLAYMLLRDRVVAIKMSILFVLPALLSLESIAEYPVYKYAQYAHTGYTRYQVGGTPPSGNMTPILNEHFFVLLLLAMSFSLLGYAFMKLRDASTQENADHASLPEVYLVVGSCYAYVLMWLSLHQAFAEDAATMMALVLYTLMGLAAYLYGRKNDHRGLRLYGGALLGFVVGRLLLVEVWKMELSGRIMTFFVIGTLLMSTAFVGKRKKEIDLIPPTQ